MDNLKAAWNDFYAWMKTVPGILWANFLASSMKTKSILAVIVAILGLWGADKLPSKDEVARNLPDYATRSDVQSVQRDLDQMTAEIHQMRIELNAVETKLAEPAKITTGSIPAKKKRH